MQKKKQYYCLFRWNVIIFFLIHENLTSNELVNIISYVWVYSDESMVLLCLWNLMGWFLQYIDKTRIYNDFYTERAESITFSITVFRYPFSQERFLGKEIFIITNRFCRMAKPDWRSLTFDIFAIYLCISRIFFFNS